MTEKPAGLRIFGRDPQHARGACPATRMPHYPVSSLLEQLIEEHAPILHTWSVSRFRRGEIHLAEELEQETWMRVLEHFEEFEGSTDGFRNWIFRIAGHVRLEQARSLGRRPVAGSHLDNLPAVITSVSSRAARKEEVRDLIAFQKTLGDEDRELLDLRGLQGCPYKEIALELGRTETSLRKRYSRLLARIREELAVPAWLTAE